MCILKIDVSDEDPKFLHVELNAANEMSFDVLIVPDGRSGRHDRQLERICEIAPVILRVDAGMMELGDGNLEAAPNPDDLIAIGQFFQFYIFKNVNISLDIAKSRWHRLTEQGDKPAFQVGDTVEIRKDGQFFGRRVTILDFDGDVAIVRGDNWVMDHRYHVSQLKRLRMVQHDG